jgi:hypothetical protein
VPPSTRRAEVLLIGDSTVASASRPSSISSTAWGFSPSELTPTLQAAGNNANFKFFLTNVHNYPILIIFIYCLLTVFNSSDSIASNDRIIND